MGGGGEEARGALKTLLPPAPQILPPGMYHPLPHLREEDAGLSYGDLNVQRFCHFEAPVKSPVVSSSPC